MAISSKQFFTEYSKTEQICGILYCEKLPDNYNEILDNSGYGYITSPVHTPDKENGKTHIHFILRDMHGHSLDYEKVNSLLEELNPQHARCVVLRGGHSALVDMSRYFIHLFNPDKQQFDRRSIQELEDIHIDDATGVCVDSGLVSIYAENYCFFDGGGLDFIKLIHTTAREKAEMKRNSLKEMLDKVLDYVYKKGVKNYAKLVEWCRKSGYIDCCIAYNSLLHNICDGLSDKNYNLDTDARKTDSTGSERTEQNDEKDTDCVGLLDSSDFDYTAVQPADIEDTKQALETALEVSDIDTDVVKFFAWMRPEIALTNIKYNSMFIKRKFLELYDIYNARPRILYKRVYDNFCIKHLHRLVL